MSMLWIWKEGEDIAKNNTENVMFPHTGPGLSHVVDLDGWITQGRKSISKNMMMEPEP
jgi:hypothetical protein